MSTYFLSYAPADSDKLSSTFTCGSACCDPGRVSPSLAVRPLERRLVARLDRAVSAPR